MRQGLLNNVARRLRQRFRKLAWAWVAQRRPQVTVATRQGRFTVYTSDRIIGRRLYACGEFELDWVNTVLPFLRDTGRLPACGRGTVVDIGANMGVISIGMLHHAEFEKAIAIEPDPRNFQLLEHNARQNQLLLDRYLCLPCAASDHRGEAEFELSPDNYGDHRVRPASAAAGAPERFSESQRRTIRVPIERLDNLLEQLPADFTAAIALVWIDTQGHEGWVFAGGPTLFAKAIPVVCEFWPYGILRSGMNRERFCQIVASQWGSYWRRNGGNQFVPYPTSALDTLWKELGEKRKFENILLTK
jgi:FkbM family methyltransferase